MSSYFSSQIGIAIPTIERFFPCVSRQVLSIRKYIGEQIPIYIGIQGDSTERIARFVSNHDVKAFFLPFDFGLSATRNFLVRQISEPYVLISDDDSVFNEDTNIEAAWQLMQTRPDIKIVGGGYKSVYQNGEKRFVNCACYLFPDFERGILVSLPIAYARLDLHQTGKYHYVICDMVSNFAVVNQSVFNEYGIWWDERYKIRGEHEDFYLTIKQHGKFSVAYCNCLSIDHVRFVSPEYKRLRSRDDGLLSFLRKWNLQQHLVVGKKNIVEDENVIRKIRFNIVDDFE